MIYLNLFPERKWTGEPKQTKNYLSICQFVFTCECYIIVVVRYGWFQFSIYKMLQGGIISPIFSIKEIFLHKRNQCWENLSIQDMKPSKDSQPLNFVSVARIWLCSFGLGVVFLFVDIFSFVFMSNEKVAKVRLYINLKNLKRPNLFLWDGNTT